MRSSLPVFAVGVGGGKGRNRRGQAVPAAAVVVPRPSILPLGTSSRRVKVKDVGSVDGTREQCRVDLRMAVWQIHPLQHLSRLNK